ncbi:SOAT2 acyltransferase, partial [Polypterus senegalus]
MEVERTEMGRIRWMCEESQSKRMMNSELRDRSGMEHVKAELLEQMQGQLSDLLDKAIEESIHSYSRHKNRPESVNGLETELFEINHFKTIYHMFIAILCVFIFSTLAVDFIDEGRLVLEFDLLVYAFGKFSTVIYAWICMFLYTLIVPYMALCFWGSYYPSTKFHTLFTIVVGILGLTCQLCILGIYPIYTVIHGQLPPASRFIVILEQIRFMMKSYSFIRENVPKFISAKTKQAQVIELPKFSQYLYFLFCPTLIYRDSYPRNPYIRWGYVAVNFAQILGCLFYGYFILVRLCIPVFTNMSKQPFSTKTMVLTLFHATLPGTFILLLSFFAFLHCWLNAFAEMLRFADRMFYKFLQGRCRTAAMLSVFILSAVVHEYVLTLCLGYFYPVMFCLFAIFGVVFNFMLNDKRQGPVWNIIMWTFLFIGQGIQVCLYCQEWYAQIHCPLKQDLRVEAYGRSLSRPIPQGRQLEPSLLHGGARMTSKEYWTMEFLSTALLDTMGAARGRCREEQRLLALRPGNGLHKHAMRSMGDLSLTSPSPKEKRQAWIQRSRHWFTVKDELEDPLTSELQPDDVFFEVDSVVRQGSVFAPILFNDCMDWVLGRVVGSSGCGSSVGEERFKDLDFADLAVIFVESMEALIRALERLSKEFECLGLLVSCSRVSRDLFPEDLKRLSVESFSTLGASWEDNFSLGAEGKNDVPEANGTTWAQHGFQWLDMGNQQHDPEVQVLRSWTPLIIPLDILTDILRRRLKPSGSTANNEV